MAYQAKDWTHLIADYNSGWYTGKELAKKYGISRQRIYAILKRNNTHPHKPNPRNPQKDYSALINDYTTTGASVDAIAEKHGTKRGNVYRILREHNVVDRRNSNIGRIMEEKVKQLHAHNLRISEIAKIAHLQQQTVRSILLRGGKLESKKFYAMVDDWKELYAKGQSFNEIAMKFGASPPTVRNHLVRAGVELRVKPTINRTTPDDRKRIIGMKLEGIPTAEIAESVGFSKVAVNNVWRYYKEQRG